MENKISLHNFWNILMNHDWYHGFSDDIRVSTKGSVAEKQLYQIAQDNGREYMQMFRDIRAYHFSGKPWGTIELSKPETPLDSD